MKTRCYVTVYGKPFLVSSYKVSAKPVSCNTCVHVANLEHFFIIYTFLVLYINSTFMTIYVWHCALFTLVQIVFRKSRFNDKSAVLNTNVNVIHYEQGFNYINRFTHYIELVELDLYILRNMFIIQIMEKTWYVLDQDKTEFAIYLNLWRNL